ncbi:ABC transporter permease [Streptomyces sp. MST-110588]|uniref:ABC transporter permease n=1 Tax=Streptomyces sp. MST-110588 TaxID=2833628 RepID=UPI001F5DC36B|nr:ABC transporter permease [Streptomyces sp. MST-110588]UNO42887.1 ABC transporter permease [Streptomyces sp. MST-110588]
MATTTDNGSRTTFMEEVRDAVTARAALLMIGVLALTALFIASYTGAFHSPKPRDVPVAVVAPAQAGGQLTDRLGKLPGSPLDPRTAPSEADAVRQIKERKIDAALVVDPRGSTDKLLLATGSGASLSQAVETVLTRAEKEQKRTVRTQDVAPADPDDARGLSSFYLVIGWCVGGYLCAAILAVSYGARPVNTKRAVIRLGALAVYSVLTGLAGAVVVGPVLGALPGSVAALWGLGALLVFAVGATTFAFQGIAGIIGIGLTILVVVIAGNPSAGGAYPYPLLPDFWRAIGPALPPGAGTWTARSIAYFHGNAVTGPLLVLCAWAVVATVLTLVFASLRKGRETINRSEVVQ